MEKNNAGEENKECWRRWNFQGQYMLHNGKFFMVEMLNLPTDKYANVMPSQSQYQKAF